MEGNVCLYVEDSGSGVPVEKRAQLFAKFQESLDSLNQGTGIGLSLCKNLADLMEADIYLDESYNSGVPERPGTRFVIRLNRAPLLLDDLSLDDPSTPIDPEMAPLSVDIPAVIGIEDAETLKDLESGEAQQKNKELPDELTVLFTDDDMVLRKLFVRAVRKVRPGWKIMEASNGETALRMVEDHSFDMIFMDQYMASVEKQLLGTETVMALRAKGVTCKICGLSANDIENSFLDAGASTFMMKPFPCDPATLTSELQRVYFGR